jgi:hypothetical protein
VITELSGGAALEEAREPVNHKEIYAENRCRQHESAKLCRLMMECSPKVSDSMNEVVVSTIEVWKHCSESICLVVAQKSGVERRRMMGVYKTKSASQGNKGTTR